MFPDKTEFNVGRCLSPQNNLSLHTCRLSTCFQPNPCDSKAFQHLFFWRPFSSHTAVVLTKQLKSYIVRWQSKESFKQLLSNASKDNKRTLKTKMNMDFWMSSDLLHQEHCKTEILTRTMKLNAKEPDVCNTAHFQPPIRIHWRVTGRTDKAH